MSWLLGMSNMPPMDRMATFTPVFPNGRVGTRGGSWADRKSAAADEASKPRPAAPVVFRNCLREHSFSGLI